MPESSTTKKDEADEGSDELKRSPRLLNPKSYVSLSKTHNSEPAACFGQIVYREGLRASKLKKA
jgi:hypothetical protein